MKATGLHHLTIRVQDPEVTRRWYEKVLGFQFVELPVDERSTGIWRGQPKSGKMLATQVGVTFILFAPPLEGTSEGDRFSEHRVGVDHIALAIEDRSELNSLIERLRGAGVATEGVETDYVLNKEYVAFRDPDNVQWEAYMT